MVQIPLQRTTAAKPRCTYCQKAAIKGAGDLLNLVQLLLKHGAVMNSRTKDRRTPLHLAIRENRFKACRDPP
jgi:ankyrin repeat protein